MESDLSPVLPRQLEIRLLRHEDKAPIMEILRETNVFTREEIDVAEELLDAVLHNPDHKDYTIYTGVDHESGVAGYYCVGPRPITDGTFDLYWIAVKPSVHNRGIGRLLLNHAEELVKSRRGRLLVAETSSQPKYENTRTFYLNNKYGEVARIKDYYKVGDDLVVYGKYLSPSEEYK